MKLILDTSALIALRRGDPRVQDALRKRGSDAGEIGVSRLTEYELRLGADYLWKKYGDARELTWLDEVFDWLTIYEVSGDVVRDSADLQADALAKGRPLPDMDLLIGLSGGSNSELITLDEDQLKMKEALRTKGVTVSSP